MFDDWEESYHDECAGIYDTYDTITELEHLERRDLDGIDAITMGMAFALSEEIREANREAQDESDYSEYDVDENTDKENLEQIKRLSLSSRFETRRLRPFEQYVDDICKGRRPLFED